MIEEVTDIKDLKRLQIQKKAAIKALKKRMRKNILIFTVIMFVFSIASLEYAYKVFGGVNRMIYMMSAILLAFALAYYLYVRIRIHKKKKEIKAIKSKLYKLMKLEK